MLKHSHSVASARLKIRNQMRRNHIAAMLANNRQSMLERRQQQEILAQLAGINGGNFIERLWMVKQYAVNEKYGHMFVVLTGYVYEHLLANNRRDDMLIILEALCQYEEIEIPQTKDLARLLLGELQNNAKVVLNIISQLMANGKYAYFRDYLLGMGLIEICEEYLESSMKNKFGEFQDVRYFFVDICCSILKSQPEVDIECVLKLVSSITSHMVGQEITTLLMWCLGDIGNTFEVQPQLAVLLLSAFGNVCKQQYFNFQEDMLAFYLFCAHSQTLNIKDILNLINKSLDSPNQHIKIKVISIFKAFYQQQYEFQIEQTQLKVQELGLVHKFMHIYQISGLALKKITLELLEEAFPDFINHRIDNQRSPQETVSLFDIMNNLSSIFKDAFEKPSLQLQTTALLLLAKVQDIIKDDPESTQPLKQALDQTGIFDYLLTYNQTQSSSLSPLINKILAP